MKRLGERGTAIVEAALTLLLFFMLLFGVMEAGRFMNVQGMLTNTAREGAKTAVLPFRGTGTLAAATAVEAEVQRHLQSAGVPAGSVTVTLTTETAGGTVYSRVTVQHQYRVLTLSLFSGLGVTLSGTARMRNETSPG